MLCDVLITEEKWEIALVGAEAFATRVLLNAAEAERSDGEVCVMLADAAELRRLNREHRGIDKATNVLAFQAPVSAGGFLGDIAVAYEVAAEESEAEGKSLADHTAHLLTHGLLHLLGYDHMNDADAERMEARERTILASLGIADPYATERV